MIDLQHPLAVLATRMQWQTIERQRLRRCMRGVRAKASAATWWVCSVAPRLAGARVSAAGRPWVPVRLIVGLLYLKHAYNASDESVRERWAESVYFQFFCGEDYFVGPAKFNLPE